MTDPSLPNHLYDASSGALGAFQQLGCTGIAPQLGTPHDANSVALNNAALGAFQGVQRGSTGMAPQLGTPHTWALASSGVSLEDVLRYKIMSAQQQLGIPPQGFNNGYGSMSQIPMGSSLPSSLMPFPFLACMPSASAGPMAQNRGMASSSFADDPQSGIWRPASGYEKQVSVMSRNRGVDRRVLLTREILSNYFQDSLDTVAEKMAVSKTTIKAACRRLGLVKWPYRHSGPRKSRKNSSPPLVKQARNPSPPPLVWS
ncbi:hypothetical protein T484DRAFT_3629717 [Baffinella frigidus]|nr:hypothetical protein T484DRAFT_3629717 [Cryptophyta sp. CCMP2293]